MWQRWWRGAGLQEAYPRRQHRLGEPPSNASQQPSTSSSFLFYPFTNKKEMTPVPFPSPSTSLSLSPSSSLILPEREREEKARVGAVPIMVLPSSHSNFNEMLPSNPKSFPHPKSHNASLGNVSLFSFLSSTKIFQLATKRAF